MDDDTFAELKDALKEIEEHTDLYVEAKEYFEGREDELFAHPVIRRLVRESSRQYRLNFCKTAVEARTERLELTSTIVVDDEVLTQRLRDEVWDANQLDLYMPDVFTKTGMYGDYYGIVWHKYSGSNVVGVKVDFVRPERMRVFYDEEDQRVIKHAVRWWKVGKNGRRVDAFFPDRIERYILRDGNKGDAAGQWEEFKDEESDEWPIKHSYGINVFHFRTGLQYGTPDHKAAYGPQDGINKLVGTVMSTIDLQGWPQRWALMNEGKVEQTQLTKSDADFIQTGTVVEGEDATEVDDAQKYAVAPGSMLELPGVSSVGTFDTANPDVFLKPMDLLIRAMAQVTNTPFHRMYPSGDRPSGESLRVEEAPFNKSGEYRQNILGATIRDMLEYAMLLLTDKPHRVKLTWKPFGSYDDATQWAVVAAKQSAGIPVRTTLIDAGFEPDEVDVMLSSNALSNAITTAQRIADVAAQLSRAVLGKAISEQQAQDVIAKFIVQAMEEQDADEERGDEDEG